MTCGRPHRRKMIVLISLLPTFFAVHAEIALQPALDHYNLQPHTSCEQGKDCRKKNGKTTSSTTTTSQRATEFFAWNLDEDSLMNGLFPDLTRLQAAWEVHPLLSKVSFSHPRLGAPLGSIPTIFHNRTFLMNSSWHDSNSSSSSSSIRTKSNRDPLISLFSVDNTLEVLSHPNLQDQHGVEYKVVRKVVRNGEEFMGSFPKHSRFNIEQLVDHFHNGGYSVVINDMQRRWNSIARMAKQMEEELNTMPAYVNLYLTPEVLVEGASTNKNGLVRQGFIAHWDLMDVIIIQLAGRKRWSVAREPIVYLSNKDTKRKPTTEEVEHYANNNRFLEFTMCPGDVMYIPRGHMHNASTVAFDQMNRKWMDWDACPDYPTDSAEAGALADALKMPSLHLTFGLDSEYTLEALLHHAILAYFEDGTRNASKNGVALPAGLCTDPSHNTRYHDVTWQSVLHHSLAEVARRENDCDSPSHRGTSRKNPRDCDTAILRQSVPLLLLTNNDGINVDVKTLDVTRQVDIRILKRAYLNAVNAIGSSASMGNTAEFILTHLFRPSSGQGSFSYPGMIAEHAILCPRELNSLSQAVFERTLEEFVLFAKNNFYSSFKAMNIEGKSTRDMVREQRWSDLEKVGKGGGL